MRSVKTADAASGFQEDKARGRIVPGLEPHFEIQVGITGGEKAEFKLSRKDPDAELETFSAEDFNTLCNGETYDSERFRQFYSFLLKSSAEEFALDEKIPDSEPIAAITYTDSYSGKTTKVEFYDHSAMKALIAVDGQSKFTISKSYVDTLISNIKLIGTEEDFVLTWK